jgi:hypothetical protein
MIYFRFILLGRYWIANVIILLLYFGVAYIIEDELRLLLFFFHLLYSMLDLKGNENNVMRGIVSTCKPTQPALHVIYSLSPDGLTILISNG